MKREFKTVLSRTTYNEITDECEHEKFQIEVSISTYSRFLWVDSKEGLISFDKYEAERIYRLLGTLLNK